ncbi:hypothetical protein NKJ48_31120 [Mesorhizobium sp. M0114]|uniref:hypothetical protein n=1 Tax=unclassified Mesorhizobium TaxID=325217 RepID=UPI00333A7A04
MKRQIMPALHARRSCWPLYAVVVCLSLGGSVAWSQHAQPNQQSRPPQPTATENQQGTKENGGAPVVVPAPSQVVSDEKADHDAEGGGKKDWSESFVEHAPDWSVAFFTFVLCVFTGLLWRSTNKLWLAGERQMKLIEANAKLQSADMQASTKTAQDAVAVTKEIGRAQVQAYLSCVSAKFGAEDTVFRCWAVIKNNGQSPAFSVLVKAQLSVMVPNQGWRENPGRSIASRIDSETSEGGGMTIPAGGEVTIQILWLHDDMEREAYEIIAKTNARFNIDCRVEWRNVFHREGHNVFFLSEGKDERAPVRQAEFDRIGEMTVYNRGHR